MEMIFIAFGESRNPVFLLDAWQQKKIEILLRVLAEE